MSEPSMSHADRETFLADLHVGVPSVERSDGPPTMSPLWFQYLTRPDVAYLP